MLISLFYTSGVPDHGAASGPGWADSKVPAAPVTPGHTEDWEWGGEQACVLSLTVL